jgi:hypothetical protein
MARLQFLCGSNNRWCRPGNADRAENSRFLDWSRFCRADRISMSGCPLESEVTNRLTLKLIIMAALLFNVVMARLCTTCQHLRRPEIDRRLAAGEATAQVARDHDINLSSLHRHRVNCLKLGSANAIKKEAARGTAAVTLLPSKETLSGAFTDLAGRIDEIIAQAKADGSFKLALSGLNSLRQTLESHARLAGYIGPAGAQVNLAIQNNVNVNTTQIAERLIIQFDKEPELKARIAEALLRLDHNATLQVTADRTNSHQPTDKEGCHES